MFVFKSGKWRWHFRDRAAADRLLPSPEECMRSAREIRNMDGRRIVYAGKGVFFPSDPRGKKKENW